MQAFDATFDEISLDRGGGKALQQILLGSAALALVSVGAFCLHARQAAAPVSPPISSAAPASEAAANPFGEIIIDPSFLAEMKSAAPAENSSPLASLELAPPPTVAEAAPAALPTEAAPPAASALPDEVPLPPKRDVPEIVDSAPLPPPRPAEFAPPFAPAVPERRVTEQSVPPAPAGGPNIFQRLFGLGQPSAPAAPSRVARLTAPAAPGPWASTAPATAPLASTTASSPAVQQQGRGGFGGLFGWFAPRAGAFGYDRYTAVYDISARTVYLPDGTRLEAHSGLGEALDNPRYVSERARGPTPPHLYELTMREASFHGVQALRLNPVGDDGLFGRDGLLAHPYMLGPNGDSNGCVSFKNYDAFLRAYENGQIKRLAVVAQI